MLRPGVGPAECHRSLPLTPTAAGMLSPCCLLPASCCGVQLNVYDPRDGSIIRFTEVGRGDS